MAIKYRLITYSNIKDVLFGQKAVARATMMLASELKSHFSGQAEGLGRWGWVGSRVSCFILGRVGWVASLVGRV